MTSKPPVPPAAERVDELKAEREAFEKWHLREIGPENGRTPHLWLAWQAARTLPREQGEGEAPAAERVEEPEANYSAGAVGHRLTLEYLRVARTKANFTQEHDAGGLARAECMCCGSMETRYFLCCGTVLCAVCEGRSNPLWPNWIAELQRQNSEAINAAKDLRGALLDLVVNVQDYEAWQRPVHALDKARELLRAHGVEPQ